VKIFGNIIRNVSKNLLRNKHFPKNTESFSNFKINQVKALYFYIIIANILFLAQIDVMLNICLFFCVFSECTIQYYSEYLPELGRFRAKISAETRVECSAGIEPGPAVQQADGLTIHPRRTPN